MASTTSTVNKTNPSLCIPRVFPNITYHRVKEVIEELGLGQVDRVDMVNKTNTAGQKFKRVFIHLKKWETTPEAEAVKEKILTGDFVKIVYDEPWFWKVFMSNAPKPSFDKKPVKKAPKKAKTTPRVVTAGKTQHTDASRELEEIKMMMLAQKAELDQLREQLQEAKYTTGASTPDYTPTTPEYAPHSPSLMPPPLERQTATPSE